MKKISLLLIILVITCGCNNKEEKKEIQYRKAYCYYYKNDTSLSSGSYYVDIETKDEKSITIRYNTEYIASYAKSDFDKNILESSCYYDPTNEEGKYVGYNVKCEYYYDNYIVKYDVDEEKDFDVKLKEFIDNEYQCIEIKKQDNDLLNGKWKRVYVTDDKAATYTYIYKFYNDGTFERTYISEYDPEQIKWFDPYYEENKRGYYDFDGTTIKTIIPYSDGIYKLEYNKEEDKLNNDYFRVDD